jgi:hypothetical protein
MDGRTARWTDGRRTGRFLQTPANKIPPPPTLFVGYKDISVSLLLLCKQKEQKKKQKTKQKQNTE